MSLTLPTSAAAHDSQMSPVIVLPIACRVKVIHHTHCIQSLEQGEWRTEKTNAVALICSYSSYICNNNTGTRLIHDLQLQYCASSMTIYHLSEVSGQNKTAAWLSKGSSYLLLQCSLLIDNYVTLRYQNYSSHQANLDNKSFLCKNGPV